MFRQDITTSIFVRHHFCDDLMNRLLMFRTNFARNSPRRRASGVLY
jgi:8-oxo-dGTP diphosphatase